MSFSFTVEPFWGARDYACQILQVKGEAKAETYVLSPDLQALAPGRTLPHIYGQEGARTRLCVYTPALGDWNPSMWLTDTIVPWTVSWLRYFEQWLVDDDWRGRGAHPETHGERRRYGIAARRKS